MAIDPLHVCGNAANLEYRTIRLFYRSENLFCFVLSLAAFPQTCKGSIGKRKKTLLCIISQPFIFTILENLSKRNHLIFRDFLFRNFLFRVITFSRFKPEGIACRDVGHVFWVYTGIGIAKQLFVLGLL